MEIRLAPLTEIATTWQSSPLVLDLRPGQVHIWKANLDEIKDPCDCLSRDEEQRAARLQSPEKSARFRKARCTLRRLLAAYSSQSPQDIRLVYSTAGKPRLQPLGGRPALEFNLSHSANLMLAAFTLAAPVGIDLEMVRLISARESILRQYFSLKDQATYSALLPTQQNSAFLRAWTCREACGKADGAGFAFGSAMDFLTFQPGDPSEAESFEFSKFGEFFLLPFSPQAGYFAAAAVKSKAQPRAFFFELSHEDNLIDFSSSQGLKMQTMHPFSGYIKESTPDMSWK